MKGIKLHPDYQDMYFDNIRYERIIDAASELGLITVVHAGVDPKCPEDVHCTPEMARKVLDDVKPEKLVLAHMGGNEMWDDVERYLVGQNVYFDTGVILNTMPQNSSYGSYICMVLTGFCLEQILRGQIRRILWRC